MKRIFLSALLISIFYQISNAKEAVVKDKGDNVSTEEKSVVKTKETDKTSKKEDDTKSSKEKDAKIATKQEEQKKDENKAKDEIPHYKGKWKYAAKSQMAIYSNGGQRIGQFSPYALGFSYRFLDQLKIATYIGIGSQFLENGNEYTEYGDYGLDKEHTFNYQIYPFFVPVDVTLAYSLTNFKKVGKNAEIVIGVGYDIGFNPFGGFKIGNNKFRLEAGVQLGRTLGFRFSYIPSVQNGKTASETSSFYGTSIVFAWKN